VLENAASPPPCSPRAPFVVIVRVVVAMLVELSATSPTATTSGKSSGRNTAGIDDAEDDDDDDDEESLRLLLFSLFMVREVGWIIVRCALPCLVCQPWRADNQLTTTKSGVTENPEPAFPHGIFTYPISASPAASFVLFATHKDIERTPKNVSCLSTIGYLCSGTLRHHFLPSEFGGICPC
jgi:hypothetical protein